MKDTLTYDLPYSKVEKLVDQIENDDIQLDTLTDKVKEANDLIKFCESKLRITKNEVNNVVVSKTKKGMVDLNTLFMVDC